MASNPTPDKAFFENVDISTTVATRHKKPIKLKLPFVIAGLGSTAVAKRNWESLAKGSAMAGIIETVGENVCGMDSEATYAKGKVQSSPDMAFRISSYRELWDGKHGDIAVQTNVEDGRGGVDDYVMSKLEVNIIERKWGQGAKAIGGEVRLNSIDRALELKKRGYLVLPDPEDKAVQAAFKAGAFKTFERHSRVGFPDIRSFVEDVEKLREKGAKYVFLKTGAYRPEIVAFTMKAASMAKVDMLTFDGAGGGTGMSPVPMMNEMSTPTVHLQAQMLACADILRKKGKFVPDLIMAGGFVNETQMYKSIAMSNLGGAPLDEGHSHGPVPDTGRDEVPVLRPAGDRGKAGQVLHRRVRCGPGAVLHTGPGPEEGIPRQEVGQGHPLRRGRSLHLLRPPRHRPAPDDGRLEEVQPIGIGPRRYHVPHPIRCQGHRHPHHRRDGGKGHARHLGVLGRVKTFHR